VNEGGDVVRDLRAHIAAEAGALATYEQLIALAPDDGTRQALTHLATREVAHTQVFMTALQSMNKLDQPLFGNLKPDDSVNLYVNLSSGPDGDHRGPWNKEPAFQYVAAPLQNEMKQHGGQLPASNEMRFQPNGSQGRTPGQSQGQNPGAEPRAAGKPDDRPALGPLSPGRQSCRSIDVHFCTPAPWPRRRWGLVRPGHPPDGLRLPPQPRHCVRCPEWLSAG
jgi:hypothetical protein